MRCTIAFYNSEWDEKIGSFTLDEAQKRFVDLPKSVMDSSIQEPHSYPVMILVDDEPVVFFILDETDQVGTYTFSKCVMLLRAFSIDKKQQGKGFALKAMRSLPMFVSENFPHLKEIVLSVNDQYHPAKHLYEKTGFQFKGKKIEGRSGTQQILHFALDHIRK